MSTMNLMSDFFKNFNCLILLCLGSAAFAQPSFEFSALKSMYANEDAVYLSAKEHVTVRIAGEKLDISNRITSEMLFLNDKAHMYAEKTVSYYDTFQDIIDMQAYTYVPEGKKFKKLITNQIDTRKPVSEGAFYDDSKEKYFVYPGLQPGAVAALNYTHIIKDPHFLPAFYFHSYIPVLEAEYSISFPKEVKIRYLLLGDTTNIQFDSKISGGKTTYTWKGRNLKYIRNENDAPDFLHYATHLIVYVDEYIAEGKTTQVFSDAERLYAWYSSLVQDIDKETDPVLVQLVDSLTNGLQDPHEKAKNIYYWVQDHIKYIAFEDGLGGFIPREAAKVRDRRYGDCKDMANLIVNMLNLAGVPGYRAWIGTRDRPYSYAQVPTPMVDNHMIAATYIDNKWIFLDGTASFMPYGFPSSFIQDKEAMIGLKPDSFIIVKVPPVAKEKNFHYDSLLLRIEGNVLKGDGKRTYGGFWKEDYISRFFYVAKNKRQEQFSKHFIQGNNKCKIDTFTYAGFENKDTTLDCSYRFTLPDYIKVLGNDVYVNLNTERFLGDSRIDTAEKKLDREEKYKYTGREVVVLQVPEGYMTGKLPSDAGYRHELFGFDFRYRKEAGKIILEKNFYGDTLILNRRDFAAWNDMVAKLTEAYKELIVLKKT